MSSSIGENQRSTNSESLSKIKKKFDEKKEKLIQTKNEELEDLKKTFNKEKEDLKKESAAVINHIQQQEIQSKTNIEKKLKDTQDTGQSHLEKINNEYEKSISQLHNEKEKQELNEKDKTRKNLAKINDAYKKESTFLIKQNSSALENENTQFRNQFEKTKEDNKHQIQDLHSKYMVNFSNNEKNVKDSLRSQKELYNRALNQQKLKISKNTNQYLDRSEDPFYKIENRDSRFNETLSAYVLEAFIPEHEKNNITIRVQPDKITLQGLRGFQDSVMDDNRTLSTSSSQSFREEFKFDTPVIAKAALQERDGDYVRVTIPKVNSLSKKI
jgi:HSP20 family molecular chaperone IbpA